MELGEDQSGDVEMQLLQGLWVGGSKRLGIRAPSRFLDAA